MNFRSYLEEARSRGTRPDVKTREDFKWMLKALLIKYKSAEIYFHQDLDGVTTAIAVRELLKKYGFKVVGATYIQYGDTEFAVKKPTPGVMPVLVDFSHGKPIFKIHTDHHDSQAGHEDTGVTYFPQARSNVETVSGILSPEDIFNPEDIDVIRTIDSADYSRYGITPDDVMNFIYTKDDNYQLQDLTSTVSNKFKLGLVANKLLLTYKNQPNFLSYLVMNASPSLNNIYLHIKKYAKKYPPSYAGGGRFVKGFGTPDNQ